MTRLTIREASKSRDAALQRAKENREMPAAEELMSPEMRHHYTGDAPEERIKVEPWSDPQRAGLRAVECQFRPMGGDGWRKKCYKEAEWVEQFTYASGERRDNMDGGKRCNRHRKIDERTASRSMWRRTPDYREFPIEERTRLWNEAVTEVRREKAKAEAAFWTKVQEAADHRDLSLLRELVKQGC